MAEHSSQKIYEENREVFELGPGKQANFIMLKSEKVCKQR